MATQQANRQWVTPTRFMLGLGIVIVIVVVGAFVTPMPLAGLMVGAALLGLVTLLMTGGYLWADARRRRRAGIVH